MTKPSEVKAPPFWAMYVAVPDLTEAASKITRLGGKTHTEVIEIANVGRLQMMMDPLCPGAIDGPALDGSAGPSVAPQNTHHFSEASRQPRSSSPASAARWSS